MGGSRQLMVNNDKLHFAYSKLTKDQFRQLVPGMSGMRLHCLCKRSPLPMQCGALSRWRRHSSVLFWTQKLAQWTTQWLVENSFVCVHKSLLSLASVLLCHLQQGHVYIAQPQHKLGLNLEIIVSTKN